MKPLKAIAGKTMVTFGLGHVVLWLMGLVGIFLGNQRLRRSERERTQAAEALRKAHDELEIRIQERTAELVETNEELQMEITERKRAQEKLKRLVTDLERSNWELNQFAKVASHDLQEPLRMVASYTQLLEKRYKDKLDSDAKEFIGFAVEGATRMQRLINDLLAYSHVGTRDKPFEVTDCYSVLGQAIANLRPGIEANHAIIANDDLPSVMVDASQMVQLFQNLIGNAIKFCGERSPRIHVSARQKGDEWVFSVQDNGIGIESQYKEKIFVVFQRLHAPEEYPGTGMGLAICKKIVERHGGRIWVDSESGKGSTFYFTIPVRGSKEPSRSKATVEIVQRG
jgi:light-regulated signal transduction histidine kinase (bacteriophytochrome)